MELAIFSILVIVLTGTAFFVGKRKGYYQATDDIFLDMKIQKALLGCSKCGHNQHHNRTCCDCQ